jgi:hypothetical protein
MLIYDSDEKTKHYFEQVKQYYYKDLYSMLTRDSKAAIPVLDPTQGTQIVNIIITL